jgi:uncharacterized protein (TIGR02646 family)
MIPVQRPTCPDWLRQKGKTWATKYKKSRFNYKPPPFRWPQYRGKLVNQLLLPILIEMSKGHCAYCDGYELGAISRETIDHFEPKSKFPDKSFEWENLFPACDACQSARREEFDSDMLKPDEAEYEFERFFKVNYATGHLVPNPAASPQDQHRADVTIRLFGLNRTQLVSSRRRAVREDSCLPIDERSFRFLCLPKP